MKIAFNPLFKPILERKHRFIAFTSGRGTGKTYTIARMLVLMASQKKLRILCFRQFQASIKESVIGELTQAIDDLGKRGFFMIYRDTIKAKNGSVFIFMGVQNNITSFKSTSGIDIAWGEEFAAVTDESWRVIEPTIRKDGSTIILSGNPEREDGPFWDTFASKVEHDKIYDDGRYYVARLALEDNEYLPQSIKDSSEEMKRLDPDMWAHVYGGEPLRSLESVLIQPVWVKAAVNAHERLGFRVKGERVLAFDPADGGVDSKALALRHGPIFSLVEDWKSGDFSDACDRTIQTAYEHKADRIIYDATGMGVGCKPVFDARMSHMPIPTHGFCGGNKPVNGHLKWKDDRLTKHTFKNSRAQAYMELRERFLATYNAVEKGEYANPDQLISIPDNKQLFTELQMLKIEKTGDLFKIIDKKKLPKSPGMADCLMMAFATTTQGGEASANLVTSYLESSGWQ